mmetsp:Transcript_44891/g.111258  ORF Transcript_44891/g.111258 Transcript_44891/m.111258 type:complete len:261 (-) Transcript_44891:479-1261(-)
MSRSRATIGALTRLSEMSLVRVLKRPMSAEAAQREPALPTAGPTTSTCTRLTPPPRSCATIEPICSHSRVHGLSSGCCEARRSGAFTTPETCLSLKKLTSSCAISCATLPCASSVEAPRCGVAMQRGCLMSGHSDCAGGSLSNTSSAAAAMWPELSASSSAFSSMIPPRAQLTIRAPGFIVARLPSLMSPRVSSSSGTWIVRKSARRMHSAAEAGSMLSLREASSGNIGSYPTTAMPNACMRLTTSRPTRPRPSTPRVLP